MSPTFCSLPNLFRLYHITPGHNCLNHCCHLHHFHSHLNLRLHFPQLEVMLVDELEEQVLCGEQVDRDHQPTPIHSLLALGESSGMDAVPDTPNSLHVNSGSVGYPHLEGGEQKISFSCFAILLHVILPLCRSCGHYKLFV